MEEYVSGKKIILAIDDDPMILKVLVSLLVPEYDLRIVNSAVEAMTDIERILPDLILLDIEMPYISGFEFLHTIKKNPKFMKTPVVIVSGHSEEKIVTRTQKSGASCMVAKPIDREDLLQKINYAFKNPITNIFGL